MESGALPVEIRAVISNRADAPGLQRAALAGIRTIVIDHACFPDRTSFDRTLSTTIDAMQPALVVLAGFMRILTPEFVEHYRGRLLNIHPSLLPAFSGLHTHQRVLDAGCDEHGASVHFVTATVDGGPVIAQVRVPVHPDDTATTLAERVLRQEHHLYPTVIHWYARQRLALADDGEVLFDGTPLDQPMQLEYSRETSC
ncbi:MAG TPA: phosphoribosylglycinamide formyltransferase [Gammaproteobacteria bacterium]|nr:phosphoribosylglycinamide formyltransferase [Gammaproteobacteria bacterium]